MLIEKDANNIQFQNALSCAYKNLGNYSNKLGEFNTAFDYYKSSLAIKEKLAYKDPDNIDLQIELSQDFQNLGKIAGQKRNVGETLHYYKLSLSLEKISEKHPDNYYVLNVLKDSHEVICALYLLLNDIMSAERHIESACNIVSTLLKKYPDNIKVRENYISTFQLRQRVITQTIDSDTAFHPANIKFPEEENEWNYDNQHSLPDFKKLLLTVNPTSLDDKFFQNFLLDPRSDSLKRMAQCFYDEGTAALDDRKLELACDYHQGSFMLWKKLVDLNENDFENLKKLAVSCCSLGQVFAEQHRFRSALNAYSSSVAMLTYLQEKGYLSTEWEDYLAEINRHIAQIKSADFFSKRGQFEEAEPTVG